MAATRTVLWVSSIVLFILSVVLEFRFVEHSGWADISLYSGGVMMMITLGLIACTGLLLSVFFFRKKKFTERLLLNLPVATLLFSLFFFFLVADHEYGFTDRYNYFSAKRDLQNGKVQLVGMGLLHMESEAERAVRKQYGYSIATGGCMIVNNGYKKYNAVVRSYLDKRNGEGWRLKEKQQLDSIRHSKQRFSVNADS